MSRAGRVSAREKVAALEPEPSAVPPVVGARVPKLSSQVPGVTALYRNHPVVASWFGLAEACSVAPALVTDVASTVVTEGGAAVVNDITAPKLVPAAFEAMTTVTVKIVSQLTGDTEFASPETLVAFALGLTLFTLTLALNILALYIVRKYREQYE